MRSNTTNRHDKSAKVEKKYPIKHKRPRGQIIERGPKQFQVWLYSHRDAEGRPVRYTKTFETQKEADKHLSEKVVERNGGALVFNTPQRLSALISWYLDEIHANRVRRNTHAVTRYYLQHYVAERIGHRRVKDLRPGDFTEFLLELKRRGGADGMPLSAGVVQKVYNSLKSMFRNAQDKGFVSRNPMPAPPMRFGREKDIRYFTAAQVRKFLEVWEEYDRGDRRKHARNSCLGPLWHFGFETGVRPEELIGLRVQDLDLRPEPFRGVSLPPMVYIRQVAVRTHYIRGWHFDEPKTEKSKRAVPISHRLAAALEEHIEAVKWIKARAVSRGVWVECGLVFPNGRGEPLCQNVLRSLLQRVVGRMGLDPSGYGLYVMRHTMATLLLKQNVNPKVVAERLGHSSVRQTLDTYSHVMPSLQLEAASLLEESIYRGGVSSQEFPPLADELDDLINEEVSF